MKIVNKNLLLLLMAFTVIFTSCSDDDDMGPLDDFNGSMTAEIDGDKYTSLPDFAEALLVTSNGITVLSIAGRDAQGREITISTSDFKGEGTYYLHDPNEEEPNLAYAMYFEDDDTNIWTHVQEGATASKLVITSYNRGKRIKGTFNFTARNPFNENVKNITNGKFDVPALDGF